METKLDTLYEYQTPEGVSLSFSLAGPVVRGMAWGIDFAIRVVCYIILSLILGLLGGLGWGVASIGLFVIEWLYPVLFEVHNGMTPGKRAMGLQVMHDDGTPVFWSSALLRNLIRSVDFLPFFNVVGLITMLLNSRFKRLGDIAAGTIVIHYTDATKEFQIPDYPSQPAPAPLTIEEQRAILDFCERAGDLSAQRRRELALILAELTGAEVPENRLLAYGNWFLKGKGHNASTSV